MFPTRNMCNLCRFKVAPASGSQPMQANLRKIPKSGIMMHVLPYPAGHGGGSTRKGWKRLGPHIRATAATET